MTIKGLYKKVEALKPYTDEMVARIFVKYAVDLGQLNKQQLLAGKLNTGQDLSPTYQEDPYFETIAQAQAYSDWKDRITPNPKRRPGVPNLYINGYYHSSREISIVIDRIIYSAGWKETEFEAKYTTAINGLGGEWKEYFLSELIRPALMEEIKRITGLTP